VWSWEIFYLLLAGMSPKQLATPPWQVVCRIEPFFEDFTCNVMPGPQIARIIHENHDAKVIVSHFGEDQTGCLSGMPVNHGYCLDGIKLENSVEFLLTAAGDAIQVIYQLP